MKNTIKTGVYLFITIKFCFSQIQWSAYESPITTGEMGFWDRIEMAVTDDYLYISKNDDLYYRTILPGYWQEHQDSESFNGAPLFSAPGGTVYFGNSFTSDNGTSWNTVPGSPNACGVFISAVFEDDQGNVYRGCSYDSIEKKAVDSTSFRQVFFGATFDHIVDFYSGDSVLYAKSSFSGLVMSTDGGETWDYVPGMFTNPGRGNILFISRQDAFYLASDSGGLKISTDQGVSWRPAGLEFTDVNSVWISSSGQIYAGTDDGLFTSYTSHFIWEPVLNDGNPVMDSILVVTGNAGNQISFLTRDSFYISEKLTSIESNKTRAGKSYFVNQTPGSIVLTLIDFPGKILSVKLFDSRGVKRWKYRGHFTDTLELDIGNLPVGLYYLRVNNLPPAKIRLSNSFK